MRLPLGCRFVPTDSELIRYLSNKVEGCANPGQGLIADDVDVYANCPQQLLSDASSEEISRDGKLFYFTPIKFRKAPAHCRDRSTPYGHWKSTKRYSVVHNADGKEVGCMQNFIYFQGKGHGTRTKWMMKEYTLSANDSSNVALCAIHLTPDKFNKLDKTINASDGGEGSRSAIVVGDEGSGSASVVGGEGSGSAIVVGDEGSGSASVVGGGSAIVVGGEGSAIVVGGEGSGSAIVDGCEGSAIVVGGEGSGSVIVDGGEGLGSVIVDGGESSLWEWRWYPEYRFDNLNQFQYFL